MRLLGWLIATFILSQAVMAGANDPPIKYDKTSLFYRFVQKVVFDLDSLLEEIGIKAYACRLENSTVTTSYQSIGACLYESANYSFKEKKPSTIIVWVTSAKGEQLPPLKLEWKNSHRNWLYFTHEFLFLAFEKGFGKIVKNTQNMKSIPQQSQCKVAKIPSGDLGNFLGDLTITIPKDRRLYEYFNFKIFDWVKTEQLRLRVQMPTHINRKRAYRVLSVYQNDRLETVRLSFITNYNLIISRESCVDGNYQIYKPATLSSVMP